jgi:hypothetical protein
LRIQTAFHFSEIWGQSVGEKKVGEKKRKEKGVFVALFQAEQEA